MAWNHDSTRNCPLAAVDQRLDDLHRLWHQAERTYFDPDAFRVAIQAAIQTARSVSFILQKNKAAIPDFDRWYGAWQQRMSADPLLVWMRDARNSIEKEGDLEAHSFVRAEIVASYLDIGPRVEVPAMLSDAPLKLVESIPQGTVGDHIRKNGVVRIQRRWVENTLPEHELLDAVAIAFGRMSELVDDAHIQLGLPKPQATHTPSGHAYPEGERGGRLPCMIGHADARTLDVSLATGVPIEFELVEQTVNRKDGDRLEKRYGVKLVDTYGNSSTAADRTRSLFATARRMFETDGHHITVAFLLRDGKPVEIRELRPGEHGHKYLMMRGLAHEVVRFGADAVILIGEVWSAPANPEKPLLLAVDSPDRRELLTATLVTKGDEPLFLSAEIKREGESSTLAATVEHQGGAHFGFAPIYEAWGKPIPTAWTSGATKPGTQA